MMNSQVQRVTISFIDLFLNSSKYIHKVWFCINEFHSVTNSYLNFSSVTPFKSLRRNKYLHSLKIGTISHLMWKANSLEKTLILGKIETGGEGIDRGLDGWMAWTWVWASSGSWWWTGKPGVLQSTGADRLSDSAAWEKRCSKETPPYPSGQDKHHQ